MSPASCTGSAVGGAVGTVLAEPLVMATIDPTSLMALRAKVLNDAQAIRAAATPALTPAAAGSAPSPFAAMLADVSAAQAASTQASAAFERGEENDIARVMLARQRASIAFEATLQIRNKLVSAYRDIMAMGA